MFAQATGFPIEVGHVKVSLWGSRFGAYDIRLLNPPNFGEPLFADIPRLYVEYQFASFLRGRGPPRIERADLYIRQLVIVTDARGQSNIEQLRGEPSPFLIDTLNLRLGSITAKDHGNSPARERRRHLNMALKVRNVTERTDISRAIRSAVIRRFWFGLVGRATAAPGNVNHS